MPPLARSLSISSAAMSETAAAGGSATAPVESAVRAKLTAAFAPSHLDVINESYKHSVPRGSESHFKVVVVSDKFEGVKLLARHRAVNGVLEAEIAGPIHAISITAKTPAQWEKAQHKSRDTPGCLGGSKHEARFATGDEKK